MKNVKIRLVTEVVRVNYVHIDKPFTFPESKEPRYSLTAIIPSGDAVGMGIINDAINKIIDESSNSIWSNNINGEIKTPLKNGNDTGREEYKNTLYINCSTKYKPEVVDAALNTISPTEVSNGDYCRVSLTFYSYIYEESGQGGKQIGIGCSLNNVQKIAKGEPIQNGGAKSDFAPNRDVSF